MSSIEVFVRIRPMLQKQIEAYEQQERRFIIEKNKKQICVEMPQSKRQKIFNFNRIFNAQVSQSALYNDLGLDKMVERVLQGYHSTIFAYGQTGSGKTFTIQGPQQDPGIISRVFQDLFNMLQKRNNVQRYYKVLMSFVQIYNEGIYDLIDCSGKPLKMRWNKYQQFLVQNLFQAQCRSKQQAYKWWRKGQKNKVMGSHKMNAASSRSHCLLTIRVCSSNLQDPSDIIESKFQIVDLAGSERQKITKSQGTVFKQAIQINKSLFTLRQVIASLYQISQGENPNKHIPYRDSKLTSLLKQSIGGNTYCAMIACLNPTMTHFEQSLQTLTYASMASYISNVPVKNIDPKIRQNQELRHQNEQYRKQIKKMSDHIQQLTRLLECGICPKCQSESSRNAENQQSNLNETRAQNFSSRTSNLQAAEPTGLKLPKFNLKSQESENQIRTSTKARTVSELNAKIDKQNPASRNIFSGKQSIQPPKLQKKTLKTTKQVLQSITMIKELITANTGLRQKIQTLKKLYDKQQKQIFDLNQQNQVLRNRWELVNQAIGPQGLKNQTYEQSRQVQAPISVYQKLLQQQNGLISSTSSKYPRMHSQNSHNSKTTTYNQFLKKSSYKNDGIRANKKKKLMSMRQPNLGLRHHSFSKRQQYSSYQ